jgi:uncharacterized membrane protein
MNRSMHLNRPMPIKKVSIVWKIVAMVILELVSILLFSFRCQWRVTVLILLSLGYDFLKLD